MSRWPRKIVPIFSGFSVRVGDVLIPAYWNYRGPQVLFKLADIGTAFSNTFKFTKPSTWHKDFIDLRRLRDNPPIDYIEAVHRLVRVYGSALNQCVDDIQQKLVTENSILAEDLRLSCRGFSKDERHRVLANKYPHFDPLLHDLDIVSNMHMEEQRRQHGITPEYTTIERVMDEAGLIVRDQEEAK